MLNELRTLLGRSVPFEIWNQSTNEVIVPVNYPITEEMLPKMAEQVELLAYSGIDGVVTPMIARYALPSTKILLGNLKRDPNMMRNWIINRYRSAGDIPTDLGNEEWEIKWWHEEASKLCLIDPLEVILVSREEMKYCHNMPLDALALCFFLKNPHLIPKYWEDTRIVLFDGTIFSAGCSRKRKLRELMEALAPKDMHESIAHVAGIEDTEKPTLFTLALMFKAKQWYWCCFDPYHYELKQFKVATLKIT